MVVLIDHEAFENLRFLFDEVGRTFSLGDHFSIPQDILANVLPFLAPEAFILLRGFNPSLDPGMSDLVSSSVF
jgi:hypothetical protein